MNFMRKHKWSSDCNGDGEHSSRSATLPASWLPCGLPEPPGFCQAQLGGSLCWPKWMAGWGRSWGKGSEKALGGQREAIYHWGTPLHITRWPKGAMLGSHRRDDMVNVDPWQGVFPKWWKENTRAGNQLRDSCSDPGMSCEGLNFNVQVCYPGLFKMQISRPHFQKFWLVDVRWSSGIGILTSILDSSDAGSNLPTYSITEYSLFLLSSLWSFL